MLMRPEVVQISQRQDHGKHKLCEHSMQPLGVSDRVTCHLRNSLTRIRSFAEKLKNTCSTALLMTNDVGLGQCHV